MVLVVLQCLLVIRTVAVKVICVKASAVFTVYNSLCVQHQCDLCIQAIFIENKVNESKTVISQLYPNVNNRSHIDNMTVS
jgi:hypothetical protein